MKKDLRLALADEGGVSALESLFCPSRLRPFTFDGEDGCELAPHLRRLTALLGCGLEGWVMLMGIGGLAAVVFS